MSDFNIAQAPESEGKRLPKAGGVYVPRHRRGTDDNAESAWGLEESKQGPPNNYNSSSSRQRSYTYGSNNTRNQRSNSYNNSSFRGEPSNDDNYSSSWRSGGSTNSSNEVQRRGRGRFMGPGGNEPSPSINSGNLKGTRDWDRDRKARSGSGNRAYNNSSNSNYISQSSSANDLPSQQSQQQQQQQQTTGSRPSKGRDFDATVLRRYNGDEIRSTSFSRSGSYNSSRSSSSASSNYNSNTSQSHFFFSSSSGSRPSNTFSKRPDRTEESSWRRDEIRKPGDQNQQEQLNHSPIDDSDTGLSDMLDRIRINADEDKKKDADADINKNNDNDSDNDKKKDRDIDRDKDKAKSTGNESSEELEDWELALQDSDEDAIPIPRIDNTKDITSTKPSKPRPAGHLSSTFSKNEPKAGGWSEASCDDMYILELYDFSPSIKTVHITEMFSAFENRSGGFQIKWLDDTKALVIFESAAIAKQAYIANLTNQIAKIKPYTGADKESLRNPGGPSSGSFNGVRPAKTDSVARRLVQGALGLRVRRTPEQIAEEKALVQAAKEAREAQRLEQQRQRQEMDAIFNS